MKRGALIVIEGVDRTGKSTQAKKLVENLIKNDIQAEYTNFPARNTDVGKIIDSYIQSKSFLSDEVIHLLFSANRWERAKNIIKTLEAGTTLIVDRYCYSGVAYSAAKGLDISWCKSSDAGLPKPDKVFFLTMPFESIVQRKDFGKERYEVLNFQQKVYKTYMNLKQDNWDVLDADRSIDSIQEDLLERAQKVVNNVSDKTIDKLWIKE